MKTIQVTQVRRRNGDGIARLAGERRLASKNSIGIEGIGRLRRDAGLSSLSPELGSPDDRVSRQEQTFEPTA